jgi:hypothetical protein
VVQDEFSEFLTLPAYEILVQERDNNYTPKILNGENPSPQKVDLQSPDDYAEDE